MKTNRFFSAVMLAATLLFAACNEKNVPSGGPGNNNGNGNGNNGTETTEAVKMPESIVLPEGAITVSEARKIGEALASEQISEQKYYIHGWVKKLASKHADGMESYGNALFYMSEKMYKDAEGAMTFESDDFYVYQIYAGEGEKKFTSLDQVQVGDYVVIYTYITNFNGTIETPGSKGSERGYMVMSSNANFNKAPEVPELDSNNDGTIDHPYTVSDVIALNNTLAGSFYVKGFIVGQVNGKSMSNAELAAPFTGNDNGEGTNILIAAAAGETETAKMVPVQLPAGDIRNISLPKNADNLSKEVLLFGNIGEAYFKAPGIKNVTYAKIDNTEYGKAPVVVDKDDVILNEALLTKASFDKFTVINVKGDLVWAFDAKYGAKMSGYDDKTKKTVENEDWFISPAMDLTGKDVVLTFDHARGPAASLSVATEGHYTLWISNDFEGNNAEALAAATWTELTIPTHGTTAWGYVSSGEISIPKANSAANCRIAWKYVCDDKESATWEIKNVLIMEADAPAEEEPSGEGGTPEEGGEESI